ncbi:Lamin Tail Domain [Zhouia amylolytica]|uniref:Lamin Tail Domain n=1 Tax=Zhouia amylolytica TaxID=376730 RepID=A0A1I6P717_9FLAO|nr:DUF5689 domain-containing protein [Zhouia amylolytica]SFS35945.1 Lamin Tail Domain [Zhouia amylolytica]
MKKKGIIKLLVVFGVCSCIKTDDYKNDRNCLSHNTIMANTTFANVKSMYNGTLMQIHDDLIIEGYVNSSDEGGNIYGSLYIQESVKGPTEGFEVNIDLQECYLFYPLGQKVAIQLKNLYLDKVHGVFKLGGIYKSPYGTVSVGRLPRAMIVTHIFNYCDDVSGIEPVKTTIPDIDESMLSTLIVLDSIQVADESQGLPYAEEKETTERILMDCDGNTITMRNSGYANFQPEYLPEGGGSVTAVLSKYRDEYQLYIRDLYDVDFKGDYLDCGYVNESDQIIISEIADPENNSSDMNGRFIELSNIGDENVNLEGWELRRYTNSNSDYSSVIDLSGIIIESQSSIVIAADEVDFESVYGFLADMEGGSGSAAGSNGDDNMVLVDLAGTKVDVFGIPGEDGSDTSHDFENGKAFRRLSVRKGNSVYDPAEWIITTPQTAPFDFNPGSRD